MKACIVVPPIIDFYFTPHRFTAMGARIVNDILNALGIETALLIFPAGGKKGKQIVLPAYLDYLEDYILPWETGPLTYFTSVKHYGPSIEECANRVLSHDPDIVCISCFAFCQADMALELATAIKVKSPGTPIIAGGAGASTAPDYFLNMEKSPIDYIFCGEAEAGLDRFIDHFRKGTIELSEIPNLYCLDDKSISPPVINRTRAEQLSLNWAITGETSRYYRISTTLSRGCSKQCRFCTNHLVHGKEFRKVDLQRIEEGAAAFPKDKKIILNIEDDNLLLDFGYCLCVLKILRKHFPDIEFTGENGFDYSLLSPDKIKTLYDMGFRQFNLSMASADRGVLDSENRTGNLNLLSKILTTIQSLDIRSITYFICGLEHDSVESTVENLIFLHKFSTLTGISLFYPADNFRGPSFRSAGGSAWPWNGSLTTSQMVTAFRLSRFANLMKKRAKTSEDTDLINKILAEKRLFTNRKSKEGLSQVPVLGMDIEMIKLFVSRLGI
jgi:anaerobic magnesium-protoporphyrin IX monomethyl ester cyclase